MSTVLSSIKELSFMPDYMESVAWLLHSLVTRPLLKARADPAYPNYWNKYFQISHSPQWVPIFFSTYCIHYLNILSITSRATSILVPVEKAVKIWRYSRFHSSPRPQRCASHEHSHALKTCSRGLEWYGHCPTRTMPTCDQQYRECKIGFFIIVFPISKPVFYYDYI
jgi:hypothetical protein